MNITILDDLFFDPDQVKKKRYNSNESVFFQGDPAHYIYAVEKGQIKLERFTIEGRSILTSNQINQYDSIRGYSMERKGHKHIHSHNH